MRSNKDDNADNAIDLNSVEPAYNQKPVVERILVDMLPLLKEGNVNSDINSIENYMNGAFTKVIRIDSGTPPIWRPDMLLKYFTNNPRPVVMASNLIDAVAKIMLIMHPHHLIQLCRRYRTQLLLLRLILWCSLSKYYVTPNP